MPFYSCAKCGETYTFQCKPGLPDCCTFAQRGSCFTCMRPARCAKCGADGQAIAPA